MSSSTRAKSCLACSGVMCVSALPGFGGDCRAGGRGRADLRSGRRSWLGRRAAAATGASRCDAARTASTAMAIAGRFIVATCTADSLIQSPCGSCRFAGSVPGCQLLLPRL